MKLSIHIAKGIILVLICVFMVSVFNVPQDSKETFDTVLSKTQENLDLSSLIKQDNQAIRRNLQLDPESYARIDYYKIDDVMQANEYVLVEFKDHSQQDAFKQAIQKRIDDQTNLYDGYAPDQVELLKDAIIDIHANYALYVVDPNGATMEEQFLESL